MTAPMTLVKPATALNDSLLSCNSWKCNMGDKNWAVYLCLHLEIIILRELIGGLKIIISLSEVYPNILCKSTIDIIVRLL